MSEIISEQLENNVTDNFRNRLYANGKSRNTVKMYGYIVDQFLDFIKFNKDAITAENIEAFKEHLSIEKGYSKSTIYLYIRALQSFLSYIGLENLGHLKAPKRPQKVPNYLMNDEVSMIIANCRNLKERLIVKLLVYTGIRVSELCSIRIQDIDINNKTLKIRNGKGDKDRLVVFSEKVVSDLRLYFMEMREGKGKGDFLFPTSKSKRISPVTIERVIRTIVKRSGIPKKVTPHTFRHTFATSLLRNGADLRIIQLLLGHSSISTTQIYTHMDDRALKMGYEKFIPNY
ncbi:MAG: tyrosine-type recombinase/integrase [Thermoplasmatales archaeon]|nr:tyrosine-type recombinase/integrase [Candidatus Thermoplasmatota archaeon]MDA8055162.1 tyrosine-type recombinase/integrase [Thermoplasmatales archaeon]